MEINCPRCGLQATEMVECEGCNIIGCVRCITKHNGRWMCGGCRNGTQYSAQQYGSREAKDEQSPESALAAMFG